MNSNVYTRTISHEEASDRWFMVLKDSLAFFPLEGLPFDLVKGSTAMKSRVESMPCMCRGEDKPHRHYFIRSEGLKEGDTITIRKDARKANRYLMQVRSAVAQRGFCG